MLNLSPPWNCSTCQVFHCYLSNNFHHHIMSSIQLLGFMVLPNTSIDAVRKSFHELRMQEPKFLQFLNYFQGELKLSIKWRTTKYLITRAQHPFCHSFHRYHAIQDTALFAFCIVTSFFSAKHKDGYFVIAQFLLPSTLRHFPLIIANSQFADVAQGVK